MESDVVRLVGTSLEKDVTNHHPVSVKLSRTNSISFEMGRCSFNKMIIYLENDKLHRN